MRPGDVAPLKRGAAVEVRGAAGAVVGRVEECRGAGELGEFAGAPPAALVKLILREMGARAVAMISYQRMPEGRVCFAALWLGGGVWMDLGGQLLSVEEVSDGEL